MCAPALTTTPAAMKVPSPSVTSAPMIADGWMTRRGHVPGRAVLGEVACARRVVADRDDEAVSLGGVAVGDDGVPEQRRRIGRLPDDAGDLVTRSLRRVDDDLRVPACAYDQQSH